jgi:hypothetical protein
LGWGVQVEGEIAQHHVEAFDEKVGHYIYSPPSSRDGRGRENGKGESPEEHDISTAKILLREQKGWIHKSSLTSAKFNLRTIFVGTSSPSATHDEVALAGKGFTPEVEGGYKESHPEMNYALVDQIETYDVESDSLYDFIMRGGLRIPEAE